MCFSSRHRRSPSYNRKRIHKVSKEIQNTTDVQSRNRASPEGSGDEYRVHCNNEMYNDDEN